MHGIGEQDPYETLDQFGRGLVDHFESFNGQRPRIEPLLINHEGWNEVAIRLDLDGKSTGFGFSVLDLYEFYWAPHTEGKITYLQTLNWLRRTVLTPIRYLASAYALFDRTDRPGRPGAAFVRELLRILFIFLPVAALTYLIGYFIAKADRIQPTLSGLADIWRGSDLLHQLGLIVLVGLAILILAMLKALRKLQVERRLFLDRGIRSLAEGAVTRWRRYTRLALALSILAAALLVVWLRADLLLYGERVIRLHLIPALLAAFLSQYLRKILVGYVGDIAVYVNADEKAASYEARSKILREAREAILRLLRSPEGYERIVLAGHSLGSVISYDLLNRLLDEVRAPYGSGPHGTLSAKLEAKELERIRGLVTFGSPLDKIYYFFRTEVPPEQAVRAQSLSFLHGFRRAPSGRTYGAYQFPRYTIPDPSPDFRWINVWAAADPVSGHLDFYEVAGRGNPDPTANQFRRPYPWYRWGYAHVMYWSDPGFYSLVAQNLL